MAQIHGERQPKAEDLLEELKEALTSDEYAVALEPHLDSALTRGDPAPDARSSRPDLRRPDLRPTGGRRSKQGQEHVTPENWEDQIAKLKALLGEGGDVRLEIHWSLQKRGPR